MKSLRRNLKWALPAAVLILAGSLILSRVISPDPEPQPTVSISYEEAAEHAGTYAEVCGVVAEAVLASHIGGNPVFLNFGDAHPNHVFTVVIWERYHARWDRPLHMMFDGEPVCIEGEISMHNDRPQIELSRPERISIMLH